MKEAVRLIMQMVETVKISKKILTAIGSQIKELEGRKSAGSVPVRKGKEYERRVFNTTKCAVLNGERFNRQESTAGSGRGRDLVCNHAGLDIGIEIKNTLGAEFVQMDVRQDEEGMWRGPLQTRKKLPGVVERYEAVMNGQPNLFYGNPPNLKACTSRGDFDIWESRFLKEKIARGDGRKKEYRFPCSDPDVIRQNYRDKGNVYIQIKGKGLYHLEEDVCNFGVPMFNPTRAHFRLRCKRRGGKGCIPSSLTLSMWIDGSDTLLASPYSLDDESKFPPNLVYDPNLE